MIDPTDFPQLQPENHRVTSPEDARYNCIAWAAGETECWWWPDRMGLYYWPRSVPRMPTVESFVLALGTLGYRRAESRALEPELEKLAIFALDGRPTHVARQLLSGLWTSKLGAQEDIEHELDAVCGPGYGEVAAILQRRR